MIRSEGNLGVRVKGLRKIRAFQWYDKGVVFIKKN